MEGQGARGLRLLISGLIVFTFALGVGAGIFAVLGNTPALWRIADLFFDCALFTTMVSRGSSLLAK